MTTVRMIATDLDGTLLRPGGALADRTRAALRACMDAGIGVVLVTGRPPRTVAALAEQIGKGVSAICSNGALVADFATGKTTVVHEFTPEDARRIVRQLRPVLPDTGFAIESGEAVWRDSEFRPGAFGSDDGDPVRMVEAWDEMWARAGRAVKILARSTTLTADEMMAAAGAAVSVPCEISHSGGTGLVEIAPPGATKATALAWLCGERGIEAGDVLAFGDMPNDLQMLQWAGTGCAVANAHPDVLAAAARTTLANDQDGVAHALEQLLLGTW